MMTNVKDSSLSVNPSTTGSSDKQKCKPCCACPETRKARDMCIVERGEEECGDLIEAHKECMRKMGFRV